MDLRYGGGSMDPLLDLRSGEIHIYGRENAAVHGTFGGRQYYTSRSGASGAGYVPDRPYLVRLGAVRRDSFHPECAPRLPREGEDNRDIPAVFGAQVWVPFFYRGDSSPNQNEHPILVRRENPSYGHDWLLVENGQALVALLAAEGRYLEEGTLEHQRSGYTDRYELQRVEVEGDYFVAPGEAQHKEAVLWTVSYGRRGFKPHVIRRIAEEVLGWGFTPPRNEQGYNPAAGADQEFWSRLGLVPSEDGHFYKVARGICRRRFTAEELSSLEGLQAGAPRNVQVLAPHLYIQGSATTSGYGGFTAVGRFEIEPGNWFDFEERLGTPPDVLRLMAGDESAIEALRSRLEAGARGKADEARYWRERQAALEGLSEEEIQALDNAEREAAKAARAAEVAEKDAAFRRVLEEHGDVLFTIPDSEAAGNCRPGTENWRDKNFPRRTEVRLAELVPHLADERVRQVVLRKLTSLGLMS